MSTNTNYINGAAAGASTCDVAKINACACSTCCNKRVACAPIVASAPTVMMLDRFVTLLQQLPNDPPIANVKDVAFARMNFTDADQLAEWDVVRHYGQLASPDDFNVVHLCVGPRAPGVMVPVGGESQPDAHASDVLILLHAASLARPRTVVAFWNDHVGAVGRPLIDAPARFRADGVAMFDAITTPSALFNTPVNPYSSPMAAAMVTAALHARPDAVAASLLAHAAVPNVEVFFVHNALGTVREAFKRSASTASRPGHACLAAVAPLSDRFPTLQSNADWMALFDDYTPSARSSNPIVAQRTVNNNIDQTLPARCLAPPVVYRCKLSLETMLQKFGAPPPTRNCKTLVQALLEFCPKEVATMRDVGTTA